MKIQKHWFIIFSLLLLTLGIETYYYSQVLKIEDAEAVTVGVPNPGHSLAQLECSADSFCVDTVNNRVGIGTASPINKLQVVGDNIRVGYGYGIKFHGTSSSSGNFLLHSTAATAGMRLALASDPGTQRPFEIGYYTNDDITNTWNSKFYVNGYSGNVGIGTTAPAAKLQVGASNGGGINIGVPNDGMTIVTPLYGETGRYNINFYGWRDNTWNQIGAKVSAIRRNIFQNNNALVQGMDLAFYTNGGAGDGTSNFQDLSQERMRIDYTGSVGIGTTAPATKLDVNGSMTASGMPSIKCYISSSTAGGYMPLGGASYSNGNISCSGDSITIGEAGLYLVGYTLGFGDANHGWLMKNKNGGREMSFGGPSSGIFSDSTVLYLSVGDTLQIYHYSGTFSVDGNPKYLWATKLH